METNGNSFCKDHPDNCSNIARLDTRMNKAEKEISLNCRFIKELQKEKVDKMAFYKAVGIYSVILLASFSFTFGVHINSASSLKTHVTAALAQCGDVQSKQSELESQNNLSAYMYKSFNTKLDKIIDQNTKVIFKIEDLDRRVNRLEWETSDTRRNGSDAERNQ